LAAWRIQALTGRVTSRQLCFHPDKEFGMKRTFVALAIALVAVYAYAGSTVKPGLWEVRTIKQLMNGEDLMAEMAAFPAEMKKMMANAPPAQRKQMEAMMNKQAMPGDNVHRICISRAMAARDQAMFTSNNECLPAKIGRSGNKTFYEFNCKTRGGTMIGKGESVAAGDSISNKVDMVMTDARGKHTINTESQMKFLGPDCKGIKPADQLAAEMRAKMPVHRDQ
jgi:hypothetical protein